MSRIKYLSSISIDSAIVSKYFENENNLHNIQTKEIKIILRRCHYANNQNNILLFMIFSTPAIKARFLFDILVRNVIYQKEWKYLGTHISVVQILSFLEVPFVLRFAIVLRCQQFLHNDRFYEACYIGLSIEQCKKNECLYMIGIEKYCS